MSQLDDALWKTQQESRSLQEYRLEIQGIWDDEAAYEINNRYLETHQGDCEQMLSAFHAQKEQLDQAEQKMGEIDAIVPEIEQYAELVQKKLEEASKDLTHSYSLVNQSLEYQVDARSKFPTIEQLIVQARAACA